MIFRSIARHYSIKSSSYYFITTPIFYVNAAPHIGHLYSAVIADAINRYEQLKDANKNCIFTTGTDEHGTKIQQAAAKQNTPVENYCQTISESYKKLFNNSNVNYSTFIRTSEERHIKAVQHFWNHLKSRGHIYSAEYSGWYCVSDETFLTESQLKTNPDGSKVSLESGHLVEWTEEVNYMFPLSQFQDDVIYWIKQNERIKPIKFEKILLDYLNEPLPDVSISRPKSRVHWGIPVPEDDKQTIYVWLDALVNYLTCTGYPSKEFVKTWPPNLQVIGKDILKFHGIYWPAFLIAAGLEPPDRLLVHSHWTVDGQKMSKSRLNVVDPMKRAEIYSMEGLRYFLLREGVPHSDGNYSDTKLHRILNSELADTLGNLLSRGCAKTLNPRQVYPCCHDNELLELLKLDATKCLFDALMQLPDKCRQHYESYNFYMVVDQVIGTLHAANNFFETSKPWELKNQLTIEHMQKLETIISITMNTLRICGIILQPIIPEISKKLLDKLNIPTTERYWRNLNISEMTRNLDIVINSTLSSTATSHKQQITAIIDEKRLSSSTDALLFRRIILEEENEDKRRKINTTKTKKKNQ